MKPALIFMSDSSKASKEGCKWIHQMVGKPPD